MKIPVFKLISDNVSIKCVYKFDQNLLSNESATVLARDIQLVVTSSKGELCINFRGVVPHSKETRSYLYTLGFPLDIWLHINNNFFHFCFTSSREITHITINEF